MKKIKSWAPLLVAVAIIAGAIVAIENPFGGDSSRDEPIVVDAPEGPAISEDQLESLAADESTPTATRATTVAEGPTAPELEGIHAWVNSQPLMVSSLKGNVVLVDFWTYTCVNCIRTFPYLKLWHAKYADDGLVILGVHTPEFKFEEDLENVRAAVMEYGIGWPVALDNDYDTWRAYRNRFWPAKYLIDKDGIVRYTHFGEGAYGETESKIRELLQEAGADLSRLETDLPSDQMLDPDFLKNRSAAVTRELYTGHVRGYRDAFAGGGFVAQPEYYENKNTVMIYQDPGEHMRHLIYLHGPWHNGPESLRHSRETADFEDYLALTFSAKSVNAVFRPEGEDPGPFEVLVTLDGEYLTDSNRGSDVVLEEDGRSFLYVDEPRMYSIIQAPSYGTYDLRLSSNSPDFGIFAFTFGVYESGI